MDKINRLKVIWIEKEKVANGLQTNWESLHVPFVTMI